jgi:ankyrin repeat protein
MDVRGRRLLHHAKTPEMLKFLLKCGAKINVGNNQGDTALMDAVRYEYDVAMTLIEEGADVHAANKYGTRAIHHVGNRKMWDILVQKGADTHTADDNGRIPLEKACENGFTDVVRQLVSEGADVNANGVLLAACTTIHSKLEIVQILLNANISVSGHNYFFIRAVCIGNIDIVKALVDAGADINKPWICGNRTPLHVAIECVRRWRDSGVVKHHTDIALYLIKSGANVHVTNDEGKTPFDMAMESEDINMKDIATSLWQKRMKMVILRQRAVVARRCTGN